MTVLFTTLGVAGGVVGLALLAWPVGIWWEVRKCERPRYKVIQTLGTKRSAYSWLHGTTHAAEVRRYAPYLIAEVVVQGGTMREALSSGFRQIAGFIFGKNTAVGGAGAEKVAMTTPVQLEMREGAGAGGGGSEKIAMTSPVAAAMGEDGSYKVSFVMPSKYTLDTLPRPHNTNVIIREMPARTVAAIAFDGNSPGEEKVEQYRRQLQALLAQAGLEPEGDEVLLYQYHPPFAPSWMRLNEVLLPLSEQPHSST